MIAEFVKIWNSLKIVLCEAGFIVLQQHRAAAMSFCSGMGLSFVFYTVLEVWSASLEILLSALLAGAFAFRTPDVEKFEADLTTLGESLKRKLKTTIERSLAEIREIVPEHFLGYINSLQDQLLGNKLTEDNLYPPPFPPLPLPSLSLPPSSPTPPPEDNLYPSPFPPLLPPSSPSPPSIEEEEVKADENENESEVREEKEDEEDDDEEEEVKSAEDSDVTAIEFPVDDVFVFGFLIVSVAYLSANATWRVFQSTAFKFVSSVVLHVTSVVVLVVGQVAIYVKYYQDIRELLVVKKKKKKKEAANIPDQRHRAVGERAKMGQVKTMETNPEEAGIKQE